MEYELLQSLLKRSPDSHKYTYGHVLIIGGSAGMVGAPLLAAEAALRSGAGLVSIASTESVIAKLEGRVLEAMTFNIGPSWINSQAALLSFIAERKVSVVVIGPGLNTDRVVGEVVATLIGQLSIPIIIDGGALRAGARTLTKILKPQSPILLTPHLGEFNALLDAEFKVDQIEEIRQAAQNYAVAHGLQLVVKGHRSYVTDNQGQTFINTTGNPGLATAGSGDVLTGIIGALVGQGLKPYDALVAGVFLHGIAGDIAANEKTQPALIASDIIAFLPQAFIAINA